MVAIYQAMSKDTKQTYPKANETALIYNSLYPAFIFYLIHRKISFQSIFLHHFIFLIKNYPEKVKPFLNVIETNNFCFLE